MIQIASEKDITIIQQIAHQAWYPAYASILSDEQSRYMLEMMYSKASLKQQMHDQQVFAILYQTSEQEPEINAPIGFVSFELYYQNSMDTVKIHKLYLIPSAKQQGAGKKLIYFVEEVAKKHQQTKISLNMNKFNPSYGFYTHLGFQKAKEESIPIGNGFVMEDFVLEKYLKY